MSILNIDIDSLDIIFSLSGIYIINVCSIWNDIIKKHLVTCSKCKKIVKLYGIELWKSTKSYICHDELIKTKIVDVQLNYEGKKFFNIIEQFHNPEIRITFANEINNNHVKLNIIGPFYKVDITLDKIAIDKFTCGIDNVNFLIHSRTVKGIIHNTSRMVCPLVLNVKRGFELSHDPTNRCLKFKSHATFIMKFDDGRSMNMQTMPISFY